MPVLLLYLFGCSTLPYANTAFSEPLIGLLLLWACALPLVWPTVAGAAIAGLAVAAIVLIKPELVLLAACILPLYARDEWRRLAAFAAAVSVGVAACLLLNLACRGGLFRFSYGEESSQFGPPGIGLRGYFLGLNRNLLLFNPALLFAALGALFTPPSPAWRRLRWAVLATWVVYVPFYASWWAWEGGMCFGPRFFQSFLPVTLLFAAVSIGRPGGLPRPLVAALAGVVLALVPLQLAGLEIKNEEAVHISEATGRSEPVAHLQLLALKLRRGLRGTEVYHKSDFFPVPPGQPDPVLDYHDKRTFQYLNNWWSIALANHLRHASGATP